MIVTVKELINGTNKEDWHHFTVTPKTKEQAEELREAYKKLEELEDGKEYLKDEEQRIYEYFMGIRKG